MSTTGVWNGLIGNYIPNVPQANEAIASYYGVPTSPSYTGSWGQLVTGAAPEARQWGIALVACLVLAVGIEEAPKIAVPFSILIILIMLLTWEGGPK